MSNPLVGVKNPALTSVWRPVLELIENATRIVLSTHENSDGDGLGSEVAMYSVLRQLGKDVCIINPTNIPKNYQFLPYLSDALIFNETSSEHHQQLKQADLFILLDTNHIGRTRAIKPIVLERQKHGQKVICIDHHLHPEDFADVMVCLSYACATGELAYELIKAMEERYGKPLIDKNAATGLYTAIMTDTASFKLPKTTSHVHRIVADLLETGISPMEIYEKIYNTLNENVLKLISYGVGSVKLLEQNTLAYMPITQAMLSETKTALSDTERLLDYMVGIPTTRISLLLIELPDGRTKVSMRSRGDLAVNEIAMQYGGGGHKNAAGCTVPLPLQEAIEKLIADSTNLLYTIHHKTIHNN
ncbi:MAG: bifunctional oligoribonuclease/PAP phosphatase NrnA [Chloroherpetonaceae bacterium]